MKTTRARVAWLHGRQTQTSKKLVQKPVQVRTSQIFLKDVDFTVAIWFISGPEVQSLQFVSLDLRTSKMCSRGATGPS